MVLPQGSSNQGSPKVNQVTNSRELGSNLISNRTKRLKARVKVKLILIATCSNIVSPLQTNHQGTNSCVNYSRVKERVQ